MKAFIVADMRRIDKASAICRANGYGLETQVLVNPFLMERPDWLAQHRRIMAGLSPLSLHAPFVDIDLGSDDPAVAAFTRQQFEWACEVAGELGVEHIVIHGDRARVADDLAAWQDRAIQTIRHLLSCAPPQLQFYIENTPLATVQQIMDLDAAVDDSRLMVNLDIGHAFLEMGAEFLDFIGPLGDRIGYAHLHSNDGQSDIHLGLHEGLVPVEQACRAIEQYAPKATWSLEVDAGVFEASLLWLAEKGFLPEPVL